MAAVTVASAMPAFAAASERANCVGLSASTHFPDASPGHSGRSIAGTAQLVGGWGESASNCAHGDVGGD
jgi:hypothetical protein